MNVLTGSLDTNLLLRLIMGDIPSQREAVMRLLSQAENRFLVADIAVVEMVFVLGRNYKMSRNEIAAIIKALMSRKEIICNEQLFTPSLEYFVKYPALSFEDCCLTACAGIYQALPLYTFDKKMAHQIPHAKLLA